MRLTTKGRYAVTAMLDLALHSQNSPVSLAEVSNRQSISLAYLEQLFAQLRRRGLVASVRGPGGGYRLAKPAKEVSVAAIVNAVSENIDATRCGSQSNCQDGDVCLTHHLWMGLSKQIEQYLQRINLATLLSDDQVRGVADRQRLINLNRLDPNLRLAENH